MKTQKELKAQYKEMLEQEVWKTSPDMVDYCVKNAAHIVELTDNNILVIEKPSIKKHFCFGYGYNGYVTDEDMRRAYQMSNHAATSQEYFIEQNLEQIDNEVEAIKEADGCIKTMYLLPQYSMLCQNSKLRTFTIKRYNDYIEDHFAKISNEDKRRVLDGYAAVRAAFVKRLNTYLKRYGLSKIETWTYLVD